MSSIASKLLWLKGIFPRTQAPALEVTGRWRSELAWTEVLQRLSADINISEALWHQLSLRRGSKLPPCVLQLSVGAGSEH